MKHNIAVIGGGSFGTSLANLLANKGENVAIWTRNPKQREDIRTYHENKTYLKGNKLNENIKVENTINETIKGKEAIIFAVPTQNFRKVFEESLPYITDDMVVVNVAKGIEQNSLKRLSEVAKELKSDVRYAVLSGPSHAEEVVKNLPTAVTVAGVDRKTTEFVQELFFTENFRTYANEDMIGVELGSAVKNVIALDVGISLGIGYGDNATAAIITRGLAEIKRLGIKLGANRETFSGMAGIGDLIVTCTSKHSRNRACGIMLGKGKDVNEAIEEIGMVVESITTTEAVYNLAKRENIEMPIVEATYKILKGECTPQTASSLLLGRKKKNEEI